MKIQATVCAMALKARGQVGDCDREEKDHGSKNHEAADLRRKYL